MIRHLKKLGLIVLIATTMSAALGFESTAKAAAGLVTVRVTIDRVNALDCFDSVVGVGCGAADFYSFVTISGTEGQSASVDDDNTADPNPDWVFEKQVDISGGPVPVSIEIRDEDDGFRFGDDHVDIDSTNGGDSYNLDLSVQVAPFCSVTGDDTLSTVECGTLVASQGTDPDHAQIFYKIEVIDPDTDGDWLPDSWENGGLDADGNGSTDVDLTSMGANANRKDLFLEIDCLAAAGHTHCPLQGALQTVVQSFANAPVANFDGTSGIQLHIDVGNLYGQALGTDVKVLRTGAVPGAVTGTIGNYGGGGSQILETAGNTIIDWDGTTGLPNDRPATNFYDLKGSYFNGNRALAFRYTLFVHQVNARAASSDCTSGWSEGGIGAAGSPLPGNDSIVSLGGTSDAAGVLPCWGVDAGGTSVGNQSQQAGTLQHEFGHALSFDHGGTDVLNNKPNYLSVMNYGISTGPAPANNVQFCAVPAVGGLPGGCDYSRAALPALNEVNPPGLDECAGLGGGLGLGGTDWDGLGGLTGASCVPSSANVSANINGDFNDTNGDGGQDPGEANTLTNLPGADDWNSIRYDFRAVGDFADGTVPAFRDEANPETIAAARAIMAQVLQPVLSVDKTGPADAKPGDTLTYGINVKNTGHGPALKTVLTDTKPDSTQVTFDLGLAVVGAEFSRSATYAVPCATADLAVVTNSAAVAAEDLLGNTVSGSDTVQTTIHAPVLTLSKSATASVNAGEAITYRLTYANTGSGAAASVTITDTVPADVYYSIALDLGSGPTPNSVVVNANGTRTLTWNVGAVPGNSGQSTIEFTARPTLLALGGTQYTNSASLAFTDTNGCTYAPVGASATTGVTVVAPTRNPLSQGYWGTHPAEWTAEIRARVQATDQRFDGIDGSVPDGVLSTAETAVAFSPGGNQPKVLQLQMLGLYFNLATRRINAGTVIDSKLDRRLGLNNVRSAAIYGIATLQLPVNASTKARYSDATTAVEEIDLNKSPVY